MPWCLEPFAEGRRRASPLGSCAAAAAGSGFFLRRYEAFSFSTLYSLSWRESCFGSFQHEEERWGGGFDGCRGRYPKFMREETYWISRQGGAKLRGSAGCLTDTEKFPRDGCAQEKSTTVGTWLFMSIVQKKRKKRGKKKQSVFKFCKLRFWLLLFLFDT